MPRLTNGARKIKEPKPENAGKLLIFCEGYTEYNYFLYLQDYLKNNTKSTYSDIVIEAVNAKGNAKRVYDYAESFLEDDTNYRKYNLYEKHLIFDCDAPENINEVIRLMLDSSNGYILDLSNLLFETWLVMHFEKLESNIIYKKRAILSKMEY